MYDGKMTGLIQDPMNNGAAEITQGLEDYNLAIMDDNVSPRIQDEEIKAILNEDDDEEPDPIIEDESEYERKRRAEAAEEYV